MSEFHMATPTSVVQDEVFTVPIDEIDRLRMAQEMALGDGVLFQPASRGRWQLPVRGTYYGVMTAVDAAGGIIDPGGGLQETAPDVALFQERAVVEIPDDGFVRRFGQRLFGKRPESVTAKLRRDRMTREPVHSAFEIEREVPVEVSMPPITQTARVGRAVGRSLLERIAYRPRYVTMAVGEIFDRTVEFGVHSHTVNGRNSTYVGREHWANGGGRQRRTTGDMYDATLTVERPGFWQGVRSVARGRRPQPIATLTRGDRWD